MRKNRVVLIVVALTVGLVLAGMGTVAGVSDIFQKNPETIEAKLSGGDLVILRSGEVLKTLAMPEGKEGFGLQIEDGAIKVNFLTGEERLELVEKLGIGEELDVNELLEIIEGDERVQEVIGGEEYEVLYAMQSGGLEEGMGIGVLTLELEETDQLYKIVIDLGKRTVESIQEVPQPLEPIFIGSTVTKAEENAIERAKEDPRVAELLEEGYKIVSAYATILTEQTLTNEGEGYVFKSTIRAVDLELEKGENKTRIHVEFAST